MRFFRRRDETLNEKLLREAGYGPDGTKLAKTAPVAREQDKPPPLLAFMPLLPQADGVVLGPPDDHGWEVVATAEAPDLRGDAYEFATLPDG